MSHIEKEKLIKADIASIENKVRHAFTQGYDLGFKDGKEKAKPLGSKPMVEIDLYSVIKQKYIEREVLDKIRAELHATAEMHEDGDYYLRDEWIDEYFDKYKAESEGT